MRFLKPDQNQHVKRLEFIRITPILVRSLKFIANIVTSNVDLHTINKYVCT